MIVFLTVSFILENKRTEMANELWLEEHLRACPHWLNSGSRPSLSPSVPAILARSCLWPIHEKDFSWICSTFAAFSESAKVCFFFCLATEVSFVLTKPTFLICSYSMLYCFIQLEPRVRVLHFPNILVKNVWVTGKRYSCKVTTLTPFKTSNFWKQFSREAPQRCWRSVDFIKSPKKSLNLRYKNWLL